MPFDVKEVRRSSYKDGAYRRGNATREIGGLPALQHRTPLLVLSLFGRALSYFPPYKITLDAIFTFNAY